MFCTFIARSPNIREESVSSACFTDGPIFTINAVLQFPPRASYNMRVSFESLNGTNVVFGSVKACIHLPRAVRE
jgi:hypothetical protein